MRILVLCLLFLILPAALSIAQDPGTQNYGQVMNVPRQEINDWLKSEVSNSGGDFDHQRYHFIIGFSTGHYGQDPVHAIAMRRLAFGLLNNSMAIGDEVTPVAWEMNVWDKGKASALTEDPATRKQFVDSVPYSTQQGSLGGHDVDSALYDTLTQVVDPAEAKSTIIILLTNSNASQGPQGENVRLFGENNPKLKQVIQTLGFRTPATRRSFDLQGQNRTLKVDVTALFPRTLESLQGAPTTPRFPTFPRESWQPDADRPPGNVALPNPVAPASAGGVTSTGAPAPPTVNNTHTIERTVEKQPATPWWLYALIGLAVVVVIIVGIRALSARPTHVPQPVVAAVPVGRPLPGAIEVTIGTQSSVLQPLNTVNKWKLLRADNTLVVQSDEPQATPNTKDSKEAASPPGRQVATMDFDEKRRLRVNAEPDTQFLDLKGFNVAESNNRQLNIAISEKLICRLATTDTPAPTRLELYYNKDRKA